MSPTPIAMIGATANRPSRKYGLKKLKNMIAATDALERIMKIVLTLI
jgi:hypothetical protein